MKLGYFILVLGQSSFLLKKKTIFFVLSSKSKCYIVWSWCHIEDNVLSYNLVLNMIWYETRISNVHSGEKLFFTFSLVINPKSLNLTSQLAVGRIRTSKHFCFCPYGRQTDWTRHGSRPVWIHPSRCGSYKWHIPTKQNMVSMGEPLTPAGSWSPSSLLMNLERGQWLLFFPDHLRPCHLYWCCARAQWRPTSWWPF